MTASDRCIKFHTVTQHALEIDPIILSWLPNLAGKTVFDVGCGNGSLGMLMRGAPGGLDAHIVGIEAWPGNVDFVQRFNIYDEVWHGDVRTMTLRPFDVVVACEILEHLPRDDGEELLARIEQAAETIIVSTPNGPDLRGPKGGNPGEAHLSVWTIKDFRSRGYEVKGVGSRLRRSTRQNRLTYVAWHFSTPFAGRVPLIAGNLIAIRSGTQ